MSQRLALLLTTLLCAAALPGVALSAPPEDGTVKFGSVYATITDDAIVLGNPLVERAWARDAFVTTSLIDKRGGEQVWSTDGPDFSLTVGAAELTSDLFSVTDVSAAVQIDRGLRLEIQLEAPGINATRIVEAYNGIAGFRSQTIMEPVAAIAIGGHTLEEATVGGDVAPTIHAFRAGADWRGWDEEIAVTLGRTRSSRWVTRTPALGGRPAQPRMGSRSRGRLSGSRSLATTGRSSW